MLLLRGGFFRLLVLRKGDHIIRTDFDWNPGRTDLRMVRTRREYGT
jgi:hypothetical protein